MFYTLQMKWIMKFVLQKTIHKVLQPLKLEANFYTQTYYFKTRHVYILIMPLFLLKRSNSFRFSRCKSARIWPICALEKMIDNNVTTSLTQHFIFLDFLLL